VGWGKEEGEEGETSMLLSIDGPLGDERNVGTRSGEGD